MGVRGEIFSTKVLLPNRTYFFNVKENRMGDLYLNVVESKNRESGGFDRQSVILFADDMQAFLKGFDESLRVMEKAVREKRRVVPPKQFEKTRKPGETPRGKPGFGDKPVKKRKPENKSKPKPKGRRVVVKKDNSFTSHGSLNVE